MSQTAAPRWLRMSRQFRLVHPIWLVLGVALLLALALVLARASPVGESQVVVEGAWARPSMSGQQTSAVYMTIRNPGNETDRLVEVETPAARVAELHRTTMDGGMMRMQPVPEIVVPAHGDVVLRPGDYHIMLLDLQAGLQASETVLMTLHFERAGTVTLNVPVRQPEG